MAIALSLPRVRAVPALLALRQRCRAAGLANRRILGRDALRWQFARYLVASGRLSDGEAGKFPPEGE